MKPLRVPLRAVFYRDGEDWVAHCLEFDLVGDGATREAALEALAEAVAIQLDYSVQNDNLKNLFSPADGEILRRFAAGSGSDVAAGGLLLQTGPVRIEAVDVREYVNEEATAPA